MIPKKLCEKHLGHMLDTKGHVVNFDDIINSMKVRTNVVKHNFNSISLKSKAMLFNCQCLSLYGCPIWDLQDEKYSTLCKTWRICCKQVMNLCNRTSSYLLPHVMDSLPVDFIVKERMLNFFINGLNHSNQQISNYFKNCLVSCSSYTLTNSNIIPKSFDIKYCDISKINKTIIRKKILDKVPPIDWRGNLLKELVNVLDGELEINMDYNDIKEIQNYVCTL